MAEYIVSFAILYGHDSTFIQHICIRVLCLLTEGVFFPFNIKGGLQDCKKHYIVVSSLYLGVFSATAIQIFLWCHLLINVLVKGRKVEIQCSIMALALAAVMQTCGSENFKMCWLLSRHLEMCQP